MDFGVFFMPTDEGPDPLEVAIRAEDLGFESIFCPDHTHVPAARLSPYPNPPYGELPRAYYRFRDPFITLGGMAAVTSSIKLGTSVALVPERDPIVLAKQVASLDLMSNGRVLLGVGAGWNREEMANHGTDPRHRMAVMGERVRAMQQIWANDLAEFHGDFVDFDPIYSWPKPVQRPWPPVIVGGNGPTVLDRVLAYGDGWFPGHQRDLGALGDRITELQARATESGRPALPVTIALARTDQLDRYAEIGASRCMFGLPPGPEELVLTTLKDIAAATTGFAG